MLVSVNIGVLLSEKLLPTQGLGLVFTERNESEEKEGGGRTKTHTQTERTATNANRISVTHTCGHVDGCR